MGARLQGMSVPRYSSISNQRYISPSRICCFGVGPESTEAIKSFWVGHKWLKMRQNISTQIQIFMTDEQLLDGLRQGGPAQLRALHEIYVLKGLAFCRFYASQGISPSDSEDILQDVVLKVLAKVDTLREGHSFNAWMWQVARNCLNDHLRQCAANKEDRLGEEQWASVEAQSEHCRVTGDPNMDVQLQECMIRGLAEFSKADPERAYVLEMVVEGVDQREIADRVGRTYGAIRTFIYECRKKLAPYVEHCLQFLPA